MSQQKTLDREPALIIPRSSLEVFPVNRSLQPGSEQAAKMTATSGRKCSEAFDVSNPPGLLLKMFLESPHWKSRKVLLTWKLTRKANLTKKIRESSKQKTISGGFSQKSSGSFRKRDILFQNQPMGPQSFLLLQLVPSVPIIDDTGYSLLPTLAAQESGNKPETYLKGNMRRKGGESDFGMGLSQRITMIPTCRSRESGNYQYANGDHEKPTPTLSGIMAMLPTLRTTDAKGGRPNDGKNRIGSKGEKWGINLSDKIAMLPTLTGCDATMGQLKGKEFTGNKHVMKLEQASNYLPTPTTRDYKDTGNLENVPVNALLGRELGKNHGLKLQPAFAEWMMGFPEGWTALDASEMQLYRPKCSPSSKRLQTLKDKEDKND